MKDPDKSPHPSWPSNKDLAAKRRYARSSRAAFLTLIVPTPFRGEQVRELHEVVMDIIYIISIRTFD